MPSATDYFASPSNLLRLFIYGHGKSKKTWWACAAAEAGFNVLLIDTDRGAKIVQQLSPAALERIHIIPCSDRGKQAVAYEFLSTFIRNFDCFFNAVRGGVKQTSMPDSTRYLFRDLEPGTVVVLDSWSALCRSLATHYCNTHKIDPANAEKTEWEGYRWVGTMATWIIESLKSLPCHLVVIGHQTTYEKYRGSGRDRKLISTREQPLSTSNPHGQTLDMHFDEVYSFSVRGSNYYISTAGDTNKAGGSRTMAPKDYAWDALPFSTLCKAQGIPLPGPKAPLREYPHTAALKLQQPGAKPAAGSLAALATKK